MYGVPGGNNLRVIAAASSAGCRFILTHTETAAVIMAGVTAELTGRPCAAIATRGPGAASAVNGMAQALLDRQAVLFITDRIQDADRHRASHQRVDQARLLGTVAKASVVMGARDGSAVARAALDVAADGMPGPVHIDYDESSESDVTFARGNRPGISPSSTGSGRRVRARAGEESTGEGPSAGHRGRSRPDGRPSPECVHHGPARIRGRQHRAGTYHLQGPWSCGRRFGCRSRGRDRRNGRVGAAAEG